MKLANILDSKSSAARLAGSSPAPGTNKEVLSYIVGVALGDGNLSNPNGRAQRLRISCDTKYPNIISDIKKSLRILLPNNKISTIKRPSRCIDISCYSNKLENWLGWKSTKGSKYKQQVSIPKWIKSNNVYRKNCLRGLLQTDGSIYYDRKYIMINFVTIIKPLAFDVIFIMKKLGFKPTLHILIKNTKIKHTKYTVRLSKDVTNFIKTIDLYKN